MTTTVPVRDRLVAVRGKVRAVLPWLVVGAAVPSAVRLVGDHDLFWAVMLVSVLHLSALCLAVGGLAALVVGRRASAAVAAVVVLLNAIWLVPLYVSDDPPRSGQRIHAMTQNLLYGHADPKRVVAEVRERRIDVLGLTELTPEAVTALDEAGLRTLLPHAVLEPGERAHGSGVYSRWPLTQSSSWEGGTHRWPGAVARIDGRDVTIRVVHPMRITMTNSDLYRAEYRLLKARMDRLAQESPAIVLGDFNASRDQSAFRGLLGKRWRDASEYAGSGFSPTWNLELWLPPMIQLDHILMTRQFGAHSTATIDVPGTDHRGVYADLVLQPR